MSRSVWFAFAVFCVLSSSEWLTDPVPGLVRVLVYAIAGFGALMANGSRPWTSTMSRLRLAAVSVMLLGLPIFLTGWAGGYVAGATGTAVLALVPVMTVVVVTQASADGEQVRQLLGPSSLALGGILLLVPFEMPESMIGRLSVAVYLAAAVLVAVSSVWMYRLLRDVDWRQAVAIIGISNALFLLGAGLFAMTFRLSFGMLSLETGLGAAVSLIQWLLLIWLLRKMPPARLAGRYLLIPLLTIIEGYLLMRPGLTFRMGGGMVILAVGTGLILFSGRGEGASSLSLR